MIANSKLSDFRLQSSDGKNKRSVLGFTLIELMVAMAIIAILGSVGLIVYSTAQKTGRISKRMQDLTAINTAIELYKASVGNYPKVTTAGAFVKVKDLSGVNALAPNYMPFIPDDPSGYAYEYTADANGTEYKVKTDDTIPTSEMSYTDYNKWDSRLDPAKDGNIGTGVTACVVDPLIDDVTGQAWAYYTNASTTCLY